MLAMVNTKRVKLSEIASLITKGTTPTTLGFDYQDTGINFLKIECFEENGSFIPSKVTHISEECNTKLNRSQLKEGDILFSIAGVIGRVSIVTRDMLPANTNQALSIIRINKDDIHLPFIKLILTSPNIKKQFEKRKQGVAQLNISLKDIGNLEIPLPPLETQKQIADNLDKVTHTIDICNAILEKLDLLVKSRFVEMFGDPVYNTKNLKTKNLKDVLILKAGNFTAASDISDQPTMINKYPCYGGNGIRGYVAEYNQDGEYSLIGRQGALSGNVQYAKGKFRNTEHALLVTPLIDMNSIWLNQLLVNLDLKRYQTGAAQPGLSVKNLQEIPIILASIDMQEQFAAFVEQTDKSKLAVKKFLEKAETLKNALMQEYFG